MDSIENKENLLRGFMGKNANSFLNVRQKIISLNWSGLVFGAYWLLYRKMYWYFFIFFVVTAVFGFFLGLFIGLSAALFSTELNLSYVIILIYMASNILLFLFGKQLYLKFSMHKVNKYIKNPKYSEQVFYEEGGTTWSLPLLWLFIQMVSVVMLSTPFISYRYQQGDAIEIIVDPSTLE